MIDQQPRNVTIFAPGDVHSLEVSGVMDTFNEANSQAEATLYRLSVVAATTEPIRCASGLRIVPDQSIADAAPGADVFIVAGSYGIPDAPPQEVVDWIGAQASASVRHGAVCTGAFLLGAAGLIDGRRVTTHWEYADTLAERFPAARVEGDAIFVRDGALFTSAGVTAAIDLTLALIEEDHGRHLALSIARNLVMYLKRPGGQSQYSAPLAAQASRRTPIERARHWATEHPDAELSTVALAAIAAMSPRNFARVFRQETGMTPGEFVEQVRVDAARRLLEETDMPLTAVARAAGFGATATARRTFLRRFGITMRDYRERFTGSGDRPPG